MSVPNDTALAAVSRSLTAAGVAHDAGPRQLTVADPSGNMLVLAARH